MEDHSGLLKRLRESIKNGFLVLMKEETFFLPEKERKLFLHHPENGLKDKRMSGSKYLEIGVETDFL